MGDVRWIGRYEPGGDGWLAGGGLDVPVSIGQLDVLPGGRARFGALKTSKGESRTIFGGEVGVTVRFGRRIGAALCCRFVAISCHETGAPHVLFHT